MREPEIKDKPGAAVGYQRGAIRFEMCRFPTTPSGKSKGISFGSPLGIGGGGRPLRRRQVDHLSLLFRFYEVSGGRILIDGQDIRDVTQKSLRSAIEWCRRIPSCSTTPSANIRYGR